MKAFLMHPNEDFDTQSGLPAHEPAIRQDLELNTLLSVMASGDPLLFQVAKRGLLLSLGDPAVVTYRQQIRPTAWRTPRSSASSYNVAGEALRAEKTVWGSILGRDAPRVLLGTSVRKMEILVTFLRRLREAADKHAPRVRSPGPTRFFAMLVEELSDEYFDLIEGYLKELKFKGGVLMGAQLAAGNKGTGYRLRRARDRGFIARMLDRSGYSFTLPDRDEAGARAPGRTRGQGCQSRRQRPRQSLEHVVSFVVMLRTEIGFYVACLNLADRLAAKGEATTLPTIVDDDRLRLCARGLYDVCLTLTLEERVVANDIDADDKSLVMITGANQGGKSTFLRSIGLAQLMMQCGMFVAAEFVLRERRHGVFTHLQARGGHPMRSGKFDEELAA